MSSSKDQRIEFYRRKHPDISYEDAVRMATESYRAKSADAKRRQVAHLGKPNTKRRRRKSERERQADPHSPKSRAFRQRSGVGKWNILEFTAALGVKPHPGQRVVLKSIYGLPLDSDEMALYYELTGRGLTVQHGIDERAREVCLVLGGRSGKSMILSIVALFEAIAHGECWREALHQGERGYAVIVATKAKQASDIIGANAARLLLNSELADWVDREPTTSTLDLKNGLSIMSIPCSSTAGRGLPIFCLMMDELGHFFVEGVRADETVFDSLAPRLAQFHGAMTLFASTPNAKQGLLWDLFDEGFEVPGRVTFQAPTLVMNPTVDRELLERIKRRNPDNYAREFGAQFAERRSAYLALPLVESAIKFATDQEPGNHAYYLGVDQSGLSGRDRFGVAIAHKDGDRVVVDCVRSWDSTDSDYIMGEVATLRAKYRIVDALIDRYGAGWVATAFEKLGLRVEVRPDLARIYANGKSLMLAGELDLPSNDELKEGLLSTMASFGKNNSMSIEHPRGEEGHGDLADAVMSAVWAASIDEGGGEAWGVDMHDLGVRYPGEASGGPAVIPTWDPKRETWDQHQERVRRILEREQARIARSVHEGADKA